MRSEEDSEESSSSEIDDDIILDNAPNWANGVEADRRQGLRVGNDGVVQPLTSAKSKSGNKERKGVSEVEEEDAKAGWEDLAEECKLVLVVRTDLGMTKGMCMFALIFAFILARTCLYYRRNKSRANI